MSGKIYRRDFIHDAGLAYLGLALPIGTVAGLVLPTGTVAAAGVERTYTLAEENIQHAKANLPRQYSHSRPKINRAGS